jgi:flagellar biosynthetic protein FliS
MGSALDSYASDTVHSLPRGQLLLRIYDTLLVRVQEAEAALRGGNRARAGLAISRAFDIVSALREALDRDAGAACVPRLDQLYRTVGTWLLEANVTQSPDLLRSSRRILTTLKEGWDGAVRANS